MDFKSSTSCASYCAFVDCKKKLKLTDFACKCKQRFCSQHRFYDNHNCVYDFKQLDKKHDTIEKMKCVKQKIDVI